MTYTGKQYLATAVSDSLKSSSVWISFQSSSTALLREGERIKRVGFIQSGQCQVTMEVPQARTDAQVLDTCILILQMWLLSELFQLYNIGSGWWARSRIVCGGGATGRHGDTTLSGYHNKQSQYRMGLLDHHQKWDVACVTDWPYTSYIISFDCITHHVYK